MTTNRSVFVKAAAAVLAVAGLGAASMAQARDHVSLGISLPGISVGVNNGYYGGGPVYSGSVYGANNYPVYTQPQPIYSQGPVYPSNYYVQPSPVYYAPPVYVQPPTVFIGGGGYYGGRGYGHGGHRGHGGRGDHRR